MPKAVYDDELDGESDGEPEGEAEGEVDGDGEADGESEGDGELDGDGEAEGEVEGEPDTEVDGELDTEAEGDGELDGDGEAEGEVDAAVKTLTVWVSVAIGRTSQLVPSEIAKNPPAIFSLFVAKPMLSAVRSLNTTSPSSAPATIMFSSAMLINNAQLFLLTDEAAGSVNVTSPLAPRVVSTEPKSPDVTV